MNRFRARNRWMPGVVLTLMFAVLGGQVAAQEHLHVEAEAPADCLVCPHGDTTPVGQPAVAAVQHANFLTLDSVAATNRIADVPAATRPPVRGPPACFFPTLR